MRFIAFILNLYLLVLPLVPCADKNECDENIKQEVLAGSEHDQHEDEACTPFCYCTCGPASFFDENRNPRILVELKSALTATLYTPSFYFFDFHSIWQPPKLG